MSKPIPPFPGVKNENSCKDCKKRYVGCHQSCENYLKWRKEQDKFLEYKNSQIDPTMRNYIKEKYERLSKQNGRKKTKR